MNEEEAKEFECPFRGNYRDSNCIGNKCMF